MEKISHKLLLLQEHRIIALLRALRDPSKEKLKALYLRSSAAHLRPELTSHEVTEVQLHKTLLCSVGAIL